MVGTHVGAKPYAGRVAARLTLTDLPALAAARVDSDWYGYFAGGAEREQTVRANREALDRWELRQRVLCGIEEATTEVTVLGRRLAHPVIAAPVAYLRMAHPDGEEGMARATAATGGAICLSTFATAEPADVAAAAGDGARYLQVYVFRDRGVTDELVAEAVDLGFEAVFLTVDLAVIGSRDRERRVDWTFPEESLPAVRRALAGSGGGEGLAMLDPTLDWAYLEHLVETARVPVVVKGVMEAGDAVRCADHGAAGVVVSNHGGRQLDRVPGAIDVLPEIVEAVDGRLEVLVDGGIERGSDVFTALALGARAVLAGRQPLWGLAAGGWEGARETLELLCDELRVALHLAGCPTAADAGPGHLRRRVS